MKRVLILAFKDLKLITRDKLGMFFMLGFPILMALFFGTIMGNAGASGSRSLKVAVVDLDNSDMSQRFVAALKENDVVSVAALPEDEAVNSVRKGDHVGVVILPDGFGRTAGILWEAGPAIRMGLDPSRKAEAGMLQGMVMQSMGQLVMARFQDPALMRTVVEDSKVDIKRDETIPPATRLVLNGLMDSLTKMFDSIERVNLANNDSDQEANFGFGNFEIANIEQIDVSREIDPNSRAAVLKKVRSGWDISFPLSMVWAVLACVAGFATLIVREQTLGTDTRLMVAPVSRGQLLAGKGVACFICLTCVLSTMILVAVGLGMRPLRWDLVALAILSIGIGFVGLMLPMSLIGKTEQAVSGAVWGICTVMAMFGGGMIPVVFMPDFVQKLSDYVPVKWAVYAMEGAIWRGFSFREMLVPCGLLALIGVVAGTVGVCLISRRS